MKKMLSCIITLSVFCLASCSIFEDQEKTLQERHDSLSELNSKLDSKKSEVENLLQVFTDDIEQLEDEIREEIEIHKDMTYQEGLANKRISYNLKLLQQKRIYIKKLTGFQERLMHGSEEVLFLTRKTESDLKICKVMDEKELSDLIERIDQVIKDYLPYADNFAIDVAENEVESSENILQDVVRKISAGGNGSNPYEVNKIKRQIEKGKIDVKQYLKIQTNCISVSGNSIKWYRGRIFSDKSDKVVEVSAEKIIFAEPYILFGFRYTFFKTNFTEGRLNIIDKDGVPHNVQSILSYNASDDEGEKVIRGDAGEVVRVFYVLSYDNPDKFTSGSFVQKDGSGTYYQSR